MTNELLSYVKEGDTILIKASHFMEFQKLWRHFRHNLPKK